MAHRSSAHLLSFVLILFVILGVLFYVSPRRTDLDTLHATIDGQNAQIASLQVEVDRLTALQTSVAVDSQEAQTLTAAIPTGFNEDAVLQTIHDLATQNALSLHAVSFSTGSVKDSITTFAITASLSGNYDALAKFLKDLEGTDRQYTVRNISVSLTPSDTTDEDQSNDVMTTAFSLTINAYYVTNSAS